VTPGWLLDEVYRTSKEVYDESVLIQPPSISMNISRNACLERSRKEKGALGLVLEKESLNPLCSTKHLVTMRYHPKVGAWSVYTDVLVDEIVSELRRGLDLIDLEPEFWTLEDIAKMSLKGPTNLGEAQSNVKFILEPLKVRTITKASLHSNAIYPDVQKQLWSKMQRYEQFELTGRPMGDSDVERLCIGGEQFFDGVYDFCSGDYSAATDNLHMDCSFAAILGSTKDTATRELIETNMCNQTISYEGAFGTGFVAPEGFVQKNGQLMGSKFSFPYLCIINMAVYRSAMEKFFKRKFAIEELPVRVNGDDILFPTNADFQQRWESILPLAGFEKSVGKNFVSNQFLMVNSKLYRFKGYSEVNRRYDFVPMINTSFLTGVKKGDEFMEADDRTYNDRLNNLRGAFRDLDTEFMSIKVGERFMKRVLSRADILDSKLSKYDLGLTRALPRPCEETEYRKYCFHNEFLRKIDPIPRFNSCPVTFPTDWVLYRARPDASHQNISRQWKKFRSMKLPRYVKVTGRLLRKSFMRIEEDKIRHEMQRSRFCRVRSVHKQRFACSRVPEELENAEEGSLRTTVPDSRESVWGTMYDGDDYVDPDTPMVCLQRLRERELKVKRV